MSVALVLLCSVDAAATLILIKHGASELNVVMAKLINTGEQHFINTKIALTALGVIPLVVYRDFYLYGLLRIAGFLVVLVGAYAALVIYELVLLIGCGTIIICHA